MSRGWYRANVADRVIDLGPIGAVRVPTLVVWSDGDTAICRDVAEDTANYVAAPYRFEVIAGVNHWLAENAAERLNQLLLAQIEGAS